MDRSTSAFTGTYTPVLDLSRMTIAPPPQQPPPPPRAASPHTPPRVVRGAHVQLTPRRGEAQADDAAAALPPDQVPIHPLRQAQITEQEASAYQLLVTSTVLRPLTLAPRIDLPHISAMLLAAGLDDATRLHRALGANPRDHLTALSQVTFVSTRMCSLAYQQQPQRFDDPDSFAVDADGASMARHVLAVRRIAQVLSSGTMAAVSCVLLGVDLDANRVVAASDALKTVRSVAVVRGNNNNNPNNQFGLMTATSNLSTKPIQIKKKKPVKKSGCCGAPSVEEDDDEEDFTTLNGNSPVSKTPGSLKKQMSSPLSPLGDHLACGNVGNRDLVYDLNEWQITRQPSFVLAVIKSPYSTFCTEERVMTEGTASASSTNTSMHGSPVSSNASQRKLSASWELRTPKRMILRDNDFLTIELYGYNRMLTPNHLLYECTEDAISSRDDFLPFPGLPVMAECTEECRKPKSIELQSLGRPFGIARISLQVLRKHRAMGGGSRMALAVHATGPLTSLNAQQLGSTLQHASNASLASLNPVAATGISTRSDSSNNLSSMASDASNLATSSDLLVLHPEKKLGKPLGYIYIECDLFLLGENQAARFLPAPLRDSVMFGVGSRGGFGSPSSKTTFGQLSFDDPLASKNEWNGWGASQEVESNSWNMMMMSSGSGSMNHHSMSDPVATNELVDASALGATASSHLQMTLLPRNIYANPMAFDQKTRSDALLLPREVLLAALKLSLEAPSPDLLAVCPLPPPSTDKASMGESVTVHRILYSLFDGVVAAAMDSFPIFYHYPPSLLLPSMLGMFSRSEFWPDQGRRLRALGLLYKVCQQLDLEAALKHEVRLSQQTIASLSSTALRMLHARLSDARRTQWSSGQYRSLLGSVAPLLELASIMGIVHPEQLLVESVSSDLARVAASVDADALGTTTNAALGNDEAARAYLVDIKRLERMAMHAARRAAQMDRAIELGGQQHAALHEWAMRAITLRYGIITRRLATLLPPVGEDASQQQQQQQQPIFYSSEVRQLESACCLLQDEMQRLGCAAPASLDAHFSKPISHWVSSFATWFSHVVEAAVRGRDGNDAPLEGLSSAPLLTVTLDAVIQSLSAAFTGVQHRADLLGFLRAQEKGLVATEYYLLTTQEELTWTQHRTRYMLEAFELAASEALLLYVKRTVERGGVSPHDVKAFVMRDWSRQCQELSAALRAFASKFASLDKHALAVRERRNQLEQERKQRALLHATKRRPEELHVEREAESENDDDDVSIMSEEELDGFESVELASPMLEKKTSTSTLSSSRAPSKNGSKPSTPQKVASPDKKPMTSTFRVATASPAHSRATSMGAMFAAQAATPSRELDAVALARGRVPKRDEVAARYGVLLRDAGSLVERTRLAGLDLVKMM